MGRRAKPLQDQVALLQKRGMLVHNPEKARQILLEIGWYRMSFYWFPFERRYPDVMNPTHEFRPQTTFEDALMLYAFDFNLRNALLKPLERIETAFRTFIIYHVSTRYPESPAWFADQHVVGKTQAQSFERVIYNPLKRNNPEIMLHHRRFPRDKFAPAWKTLEFMTLGTMCNLYESLANHNIKHDIARHFGVDSESIFENYMEVIRGLRNICAHGNVLYSYRPRRSGAALSSREPRRFRAIFAVDCTWWSFFRGDLSALAEGIQGGIGGSRAHIFSCAGCPPGASRNLRTACSGRRKVKRC